MLQGNDDDPLQHILLSSDSTSNTAFSSISTSKPTSTLGKCIYTHAPSLPARFLSPVIDSGLKLLTTTHSASSPLPTSSPSPSTLNQETKAELDSDVQPESFTLEPGPGLPSCGLTLDYYEWIESRIGKCPQVYCNQGAEGLSEFTCLLCIQAHTSPLGIVLRLLLR